MMFWTMLRWAAVLMFLGIYLACWVGVERQKERSTQEARTAPVIVR